MGWRHVRRVARCVHFRLCRDHFSRIWQSRRSVFVSRLFRSHGARLHGVSRDRHSNDCRRQKVRNIARRLCVRCNSSVSRHHLHFLDAAFVGRRIVEINEHRSFEKKLDVNDEKKRMYSEARKCIFTQHFIMRQYFQQLYYFINLLQNFASDKTTVYGSIIFNPFFLKVIFFFNVWTIFVVV